ncbi:hypothetical protein EG68_04631 [Paragonimus skrjabini miyazakii]|uniref:Uncharacterized protein n=1 Tax=Paragonimus skrjabini miyazakii TaxID=59628 RepID=A0A8S9YBT2_9TREM|nr:hypothetical protein EG68_04631 [Paragonimus skrjabini miyazakii]
MVLLVFIKGHSRTSSSNPARPREDTICKNVHDFCSNANNFLKSPEKHLKKHARKFIKKF